MFMVILDILNRSGKKLAYCNSKTLSDPNNPIFMYRPDSTLNIFMDRLKHI